MIKRIRVPFTRSLGIALSSILLFSSSKWEEMFLVSGIFFFVGCILVGAASIGRLWCLVYLAGYKNSDLITVGPYAMSRNPLYFFSLLGALGVALITETLLIPVAVVIVFAIYYPVVIRSEEKKLLDLHGSRFRHYCQSTPAFFPKLYLLKEPEQYVVHPQELRKGLFDALWFVWLVGVVELYEALHEARVLPTYITIY